MKNLPKIVLISLSVLALISFVWVLIDFDSNIDQNILINKASTTFIVWLSLIATIVTVCLFVYYKVRDVLVHPSHLKEMITVIGILIAALVIGIIFGGSEAVLINDGTRLEPSESRFIGSGLVASIVLLLVSTGFLAYDAVKSTLK